MRWLIGWLRTAPSSCSADGPRIVHTLARLTVSTVNGGISGLVRAMAVQLAPRRVNAIHPGIVGDSPYWTENQEFTAEGPSRRRRPGAT